MMETTKQATNPPSPTKLPPPLRTGDHLSADEFLRRYDAMPFLKKAELIEGVVYIPSPDFFPEHWDRAPMASPVSFENHASPHFNVITWLGQYAAFTQGVEGGDNGTIRLDPDNVPQPDAFLLISPSRGGQSRLSTDGYIQGSPELVLEIAFSSVSKDLHEKLEVYRRHGAREYIVWRVEDRAIDWFVLREGRYDRLALGSDGLYRSEIFPGLWLDPEALIRGDLAAVFQAVQLGLATPEHAEFVARLRNPAPAQ